MPQQEPVPAVGAASLVGLESPRKSLGDSPLGVQGFGVSQMSNLIFLLILFLPCKHVQPK